MAVGESQSALFLTTYVNVVDPRVGVYDGFLVHSRFGPAAPLDGSSIFDDGAAPQPDAVPFVLELRAPVLTVITETDLVGGVRAGYWAARQPDSDMLRTWEIPGTAHADNYTIKVGFIDSGSAALADLVAAYEPTSSLMGQELPYCINFGPQHHYVLQAALAAPGGLGAHRRAAAERRADRPDRNRPAGAGTRPPRARDGRGAHAVGGRPRRPHLGSCDR